MSDLISRQDAIDALEREQSLVERPITETRWFDLGLRKAQDVLSELPSAQPNLQPTCNQLATDCISRQDAIDALRDVSEHYTEKGREWHPHVNFMVNAIQELPSVEPERKKGKWLEMRYCDYYVQDLQMCRCSECGRYDIRPYLYYFSKPEFCSWCGARMEL